jgi:phytoene dehydrogenase-like protein
MYDAIIIGAGMSGLAAGIRLAHFEKRVCIVERHTTIGGLNSFYRLRGRNYDVGLHAVTNYAAKGARRGPMMRLLRQLRLSWDDLALAPQTLSEVVFPGARLQFSNDFELFQAEVRRAFPKQQDNLRRLLAELVDYDDFGCERGRRSARAVVGQIIDDPLLVEMLFCPLLFYGSASEHDMEFSHFSILFRSIFEEGMGRPREGVRRILKKLVRRFKELGGELRLRAGVRRIAVREGAVEKLVLDDGTELVARRVLSSAGWHETARLCDLAPPGGGPPAGRITFVESMAVLNRLPRELGHDRTIVFFNDSPTFDYRVPDDLVDLRSGVICSPNNFVYDLADGDSPSEGLVRMSALANFDRWAALSGEDYRLAKLGWYDKMVASAIRFMPDFRGALVETDMFTPITVRRYTGHENGAVYGTPEKRYDGTTHLKNLFLCGNDQGLVGIVGTILSGITIANRYVLGEMGAST